jgi:hypothetical protein
MGAALQEWYEALRLAGEHDLAYDKAVAHAFLSLCRHELPVAPKSSVFSCCRGVLRGVRTCDRCASSHLSQARPQGRLVRNPPARCIFDPSRSTRTVRAPPRPPAPMLSGRAADSVLGTVELEPLTKEARVLARRSLLVANAARRARCRLRSKMWAAPRGPPATPSSRSRPSWSARAALAEPF